jgi:methylated-DNA-[protein]-cysteine S-methyltransferase
MLFGAPGDDWSEDGMQYTSRYHSPLGDMLLAADDSGLTGLWFEGQRHFALNLDEEHEERETPLLTTTKQWLDTYFSGSEPGFTVPVHLTGTAFQNEVWELLCTIPYGHTATYGEIAEKVAAKRGVRSMSPRAIGSAVGRNQISIIVPCHRVVGASGSLTGYSGGVDRKMRLLRLEHADTSSLFVP